MAVSPNGHYYSTLSLWDSFRAQQPLLAEFVPERVDGIVQTLLLHWKAAGFLPVWALAGRDNQCMVGSHAVPVIVDAYLRGFRGFDVPLAYAAVRDTLRNVHPARQKERWDLLDRYGYYPFDAIRGESVSRTLECAYDDACAARFAEALGRADDAAFFRRRAANWTNVIDRTIGFARGRDTAGRWREPFDPLTCGQGAEHPNDFTEGNAWQYTWHALHDVPGLVAWLGGREAFERKLDRLFVEPPVMKGFGTMEYLEHSFGQYSHGNEQVHHVPWLYCAIGRRDKAAAWTRRICEEAYADRPAGYRGNEDCGQMSAWYVFATLGRYPLDPCGGTYVEAEPLAPIIRLNRPAGWPRRLGANRPAAHLEKSLNKTTDEGAEDPELSKLCRYRFNGGIPADPEGETCPVGRFQPNAWGLYDMLGNVAEICLDRVCDPIREITVEQNDPKGESAADAPNNHIARGCGYNGWPYNLRAAYRGAVCYQTAANSIGFRLCCPVTVFR